MNFLIAIFLWSLFGFVHSFMARPYFKKKINEFFGNILKNIFIDFYFLSQCILFYFLYGIIKNIEYGEVLFTIPESFKGAYYLFIF